MTPDTTEPKKSKVIVSSMDAGGAASARSGWLIQITQIGKYHTRQGHGFGAEDFNALDDLLRGRKVDQIGKANTLNGPDRITDGVPIQTKYCRNAASSFKAAFDENGYFRYGEQVIEVPRGQREQAVAMLEQAIRDGRVPGETDPARAGARVREGNASYHQARQVMKPWNIDSIAFDARLHAGNAAISVGIELTCDFLGQWQRSKKKSAEEEPFRINWSRAARKAALGGVKTLASGILTSQFVRSRIARKLTVSMRSAVKGIARTKPGRQVVDSIASASCGRVVRGAAATNHVSRWARSSAIGCTVNIAISIAPNVGRAMVGRMEWSAVARRSAETVACTSAGMVGWTMCFTGATVLLSGVLTGGTTVVIAGVVGTAGSLVASEGAGWLARTGLTSAFGEEREFVADMTFPIWLDQLLWARSATSEERDSIREMFGASFARFRRFDAQRPDRESLEQARDIISERLDALRTVQLAPGEGRPVLQERRAG